MGRLAKIIKSFADKISGTGSSAQLVAVEEFRGDQRKAQVFGPCNEDFAPPAGIEAVTFPLGRGRGQLTALGFHNQKIAPTAIAGERRVFSTGADGAAVKAEVFLKQDGTILIKNPKCTITITTAGVVTLVTDDEIDFSNPGGYIELTKAGKLTSIVEDDVKFSADGESVLTLGDDGVATIGSTSQIGFLIGSILAPSGFIFMDSTGAVTIYGGLSATVQAPTINLQGNVNITGNVTSTGTFQNNGVNIGSTHVHGGVQRGSVNTYVPQ